MKKKQEGNNRIKESVKNKVFFQEEREPFLTICSENTLPKAGIDFRESSPFEKISKNTSRIKRIVKNQTNGGRISNILFSKDWQGALSNNSALTASSKES